MSKRAARQRIPHAPPQLLVLPPAHAALVLPQRRRLQLRRGSTRRHRAVAVSLCDVKDAPREQLDLALALACLGVLVRVALRVVRVRRAPDRGRRRRGARLGELADVRDQDVRAADAADELRVCKEVVCQMQPGSESEFVSTYLRTQAAARWSIRRYAGR